MRESKLSSDPAAGDLDARTIRQFVHLCRIPMAVINLQSGSFDCCNHRFAGILGYSPEEFARFEENIRREYSRVPGPLFRRKRARILRALLARPDIYSTDWFRSRYEQRARRNLRDAVAKLGG